MIKLLNILNEWKVVRYRVHNLDKPGVKFEDIQIGDVLKFSFNDELGHDTVMQRVISLTSPYIGGIITQTLDSKGNLKPNAKDYWDKNAIENYWQDAEDINEWKIVKPPRVHNLDKPGVRFEDIQKGDILKFTFHDELGNDAVMQRVISLDSPYENTKGLVAQDLDEEGDLIINRKDFWDKKTIENYWQGPENINEWKIVSIPKEWKRTSIDPDPDPEEDIEIESYSTPMEGWDDNNHDIVSIYKTPKEDALTNEPLKVKYYVTISLAFGDYTTSDYFDTYYKAKSYAIKEMNEITKENNRLNEWKIKSLLSKGWEESPIEDYNRYDSQNNEIVNSYIHKIYTPDGSKHINDWMVKIQKVVYRGPLNPKNEPYAVYIIDLYGAPRRSVSGVPYHDFASFKLFPSYDSAKDYAFNVMNQISRQQHSIL